MHIAHKKLKAGGDVTGMNMKEIFSRYMDMMDKRADGGDAPRVYASGCINRIYGENKITGVPLGEIMDFIDWTVDSGNFGVQECDYFVRGVLNRHVSDRSYKAAAENAKMAAVGKPAQPPEILAEYRKINPLIASG